MHLRPIHILLRIASVATPIEEVVAAHDEIATREGGVWFGIKTRPLSEDTISAMRRQIADGHPAYFYLVQRRNCVFQIFRNNVSMLSRNLPHEDTGLVPRYYNVLGLAAQMKSWLRLSAFEKVNDSEFNRLHVDSSGTQVAKAMARSMLSLATVFRQ